MSVELDQTAQIAVRVHGDGRVELLAELLGIEVPQRSASTIDGAAKVTAAISEAAIHAAAQSLANRTHDGLIVTVQVRRREPTLNEIAAALVDPSKTL